MDNHAYNLDEKFYHFCHLHIERSHRNGFVFYNLELYNEGRERGVLLTPY